MTEFQQKYDDFVSEIIDYLVTNKRNENKNRADSALFVVLHGFDGFI